MTIPKTNLWDVRIIAYDSLSSRRRCRRRRKKEKNGVQGRQDSCINSARGTEYFYPPEVFVCPHEGEGVETTRIKRTWSAREKTRPTDEEGTARVNSCVIFLSLTFSLAPSPSSVSPYHPFLVSHGPRFKYQRRLKSDLYHAESCCLYRFIGDLLARYSEGGILV